jgi:hypothetical protein
MLRQSALANGLNRNRFVTEEAGEPYLRDRKRKDKLHALRQAKATLKPLASQSTHGSEAALTRAAEAVVIAESPRRTARRLAAQPTPIKAEGPRVSIGPSHR